MVSAHVPCVQVSDHIAASYVSEPGRFHAPILCACAIKILLVNPMRAKPSDRPQAVWPMCHWRRWAEDFESQDASDVEVAWLCASQGIHYSGHTRSMYSTMRIRSPSELHCFETHAILQNVSSSKIDNPPKLIPLSVSILNSGTIPNTQTLILTVHSCCGD